MTSSLGSRLEELRLLKAPTPLATFLYIYTLATQDCVIENSLGTRALLVYLGKPSLPVEKYPEILNPKFSVPTLLRGYNGQELARLIAGDSAEYSSCNEYIAELRKISNAIYFVMTKEIIYEVY